MKASNVSPVGCGTESEQRRCVDFREVQTTLREGLQELLAQCGDWLTIQEQVTTEASYSNFEKTFEEFIIARTSKPDFEDVRCAHLPRVCSQTIAAQVCFARDAISWFGFASTVNHFMPFPRLVADPGLLASLTFLIVNIMGYDYTKSDVIALSSKLLETYASALGSTSPDIPTATAAIPVHSYLARLNSNPFNLARQTHYRRNYRRTVIFGEFVLSYAVNGLSWGDENPIEIFNRCKHRTAICYFTNMGLL